MTLIAAGRQRGRYPNGLLELTSPARGRYASKPARRQPTSRASG